MRQILIDPWIFEGVFDRHDPTRLELIKQFFDEVLRDRTSQPLPVLEEAFHDRFHQGATRGAKILMMRWLGRMVRETPGANEATVSPMPDDTGGAWKESLFEACAPDECDSWRSATLVYPSQRSHLWPSTSTTTIHGLAGPAERANAILQELDAHSCYRHDVNPWLFRASADREVERTNSSFNHPCRLPVPPELLANATHQDAPNILHFPLADWANRLAIARETGWLRTTHGYFIPSVQWLAPTVTRLDWRKRSAFPTGTKETGKGKKTGPMDYLGQVWWWDVLEHHWDVQDPDPAKHDVYITLMETGKKR